MTEVVLGMINEVTELGMFRKIYEEGKIKLNVSKLARELGKDRKTVKKYLEGKVKITTRERRSYLDDFREEIITLLEDEKRSFDYIEHLYRYLKRENGISCSRTTLNRYIRKDEYLNKLFTKKKNEGFTERFETSPGVQAQFDLKERVKIIYESGEEQRVNVATLTLGFSRYNVRKIVLDTKYETVVSFLAEAFEELGGVTEELVIDNIKCLVDKPRTANGGEAILNTKFTEFLKDYNIKCIPCMPYRPQTKGKTETQNKKPGQLENYNGTYRDLYEVHEKLELINKEDNESISQATKLPRVFLLEKEKDELSKLPARSIREKYHLSIKEVAVSNESLVSYKSNKYSVPKRFIGLKVSLIAKDNQLYMYYNRKIIAVHHISKKILNILPEHELKYPVRLATIVDNDIVKIPILNELENIIYDND